MLRRRNQSEGPSSLRSADATVVDGGAVAACQKCGGELEAGDRFCARCGAEVAIAVETASAETLALPGTSLLEGARTKRGVRWRLVGTLLGGAALLAAASVIGLLVIAWQSERSGKHHTQRALAQTRSQLEASRAKLAATEATLAATEARLASTRRRLAGAQALSKRQAGILGQTAVVLRQVDPLLTDVDKLQQITGSIQAGRDTFTTDVALLVADLIALGNDLINESNSPYPDYSYINYSEIPTVNDEIANVRAEAGSLTSSDSDYTEASATFGNHADAFTRAVRRLQRELKALPQPSR